MRFDDPAWLEEERRCLSALRRGDRAAFARLYDAFAGPLHARVLLPRLGDAHAAEDALAETFRTFLERLDQYQDRGGSVWGWLATIAAHKADDLHRDRTRSGRALASYQRLIAPLCAAEDAPGADAAAEQARLGEAVARVLGELSPRYRRTLELRFLEERPRAACAEAMAVKLGTFDVLLLRALRAFARRWQEITGAAP